MLGRKGLFTQVSSRRTLACGHLLRSNTFSLSLQQSFGMCSVCPDYAVNCGFHLPWTLRCQCFPSSSPVSCTQSPTACCREKPLETSESLRGQSSTHGPGKHRISAIKAQPEVLQPSPSLSASFSVPLLGFPASRLPFPAAAQSHAVMDVINICSESSRSFRASFEPLIINVSIWAPFFLVTSQLHLEREGRESASQW